MGVFIHRGDSKLGPFATLNGRDRWPPAPTEQPPKETLRHK